MDMMERIYVKCCSFSWYYEKMTNQECAWTYEPNKSIVIDSHLLPHMDDLFSEMLRAPVFPTNNLAYHHVWTFSRWILWILKSNAHREERAVRRTDSKKGVSETSMVDDTVQMTLVGGTYQCMFNVSNDSIIFAVNLWCDCTGFSCLYLNVSLKGQICCEFSSCFSSYITH